ncbi:MAG: response regulator [Parcubacteria group bacterium]|jgi:two-component system alkaline phosphatase synthesis response regulator PhoP
MDNTKKKILVVDDDHHLLETIGHTLKDAGFEVLTAYDGQEGLNTAYAQKPDLIIFDVIMPKMDGLTALRELRKDQWGGNVPVIILTNASDNDKLAEALELGIDEYIIKSNVQLSHIAERIKRMLGV